MQLPKTIVFEMQPYGVETLGQLSLGEYNGYPCVHGVVLEGYEISRLFQHTSERSTKGRRRTIYGIKQAELDAGRAVRVAM
jgi:hypothetical protein